MFASVGMAAVRAPGEAEHLCAVLQGRPRVADLSLPEGPTEVEASVERLERRFLIERAANGFANDELHNDCKENARYANDEKSIAPSKILKDPTASEKGGE